MSQRSNDELSAVWREWKNCNSYAELARRLNLSSRKAAWRLVRKAEKIFATDGKVTVDSSETDKLTVYSKSKRIRTLDDLLKAANVDRKVWTVRSWTANSWEALGKDGTPTPLFQAKASLDRAPTYMAPVIRNPVRIKARARKLNDEVLTALILPDSQHGFRWDRERRTLDPMHDEGALSCALKLAELLDPDEVICLGDMLDLAPWSLRFPRDASLAYTTQPSIEALHQLLAALRRICPSANYVYLGGNHEDRIQRAIIERLGEAEGLKQADNPDGHSVLSIPHLLQLDGLDIKYIEYKDEYWLWDKVRVWHGTVVKKGGGKTAAAMAQAGQHHEIVGHIHRLELAMKTLWGPHGYRTITCMSPGCLTRIDGVVPAATPRVDWQQGLGVVRMDRKTGDISMYAIPINRGRFIWEGKVYSAD